MGTLLRILLAAGATWGVGRGVKELARRKGWRPAWPQISVGASVHLGTARASWHFRLGREETAPVGVLEGPSAPALLLTDDRADGGFYVYDDGSHGRARIHRNDCRYCRPAGDDWHGPYAESGAALAAAEAFGHPDTGFCQACCKDLSAD